METKELLAHARILRNDLAGELPNGVGNTIDALADRIDHLLAEIARKDAALRSIAEWSDTALGFESCARDMRATAKDALRG